MLTLAHEKICPIATVLKDVDPTAETGRLGSWGILYLICGAVAGHSGELAASFGELIPSGQIAHRDWLLGRSSDAVLVLDFSNIILGWVQDDSGLAVATGRLAEFERERGNVLSDTSRAQFLNYFRLAIMLNSLGKLEMEELAPIRRWASDHEDGWATLFFAAGVFLRGRAEFPWQSVGGGLQMASHTAKDKVKSLLAYYASEG